MNVVRHDHIATYGDVEIVLCALRKKNKVGDIVTVHYTSGHHIYNADPDNIATKIKVKGTGGSKN
jgi:hypothetical protein